MAEARWIVEFHDDFESEFEAMEADVQDALFYKHLIKKADARFDEHLEALSAARKRKKD